MDKNRNCLASLALCVSMENKNKPEESSGALRKRFIEPPFSIIDAKTGAWRERKKKWLDIGIKSELGRDATTFSTKASTERGYDYMNTSSSDVSVFDPALCELMYKWFCPDGGKILDSFAGGSVRGIVASKLGYKYTGIELRKEQVDENVKQGKELCKENEPKWIAGDSNKELDKIEDEFDFVFSCPPYADLEVYSKDEDDISNMPYDQFLLAYRSIINKTVSKLKAGHLAVFVVGDVRDKDGYYYDFVSDTKKAFIDSGAKLYNEAILLDPIGTAMIRANNSMSSKKLVKVHQNILCFKKLGDINALKKKIVLDYISKCDECGGNIKRIDGSRICEDCMKEF